MREGSLIYIKRIGGACVLQLWLFFHRHALSLYCEAYFEP